MSLGWMVAAVKIYPGELTGAERAAFVGLAEQTPKGSRRSWATQADLMDVTGIKTRGGIDKVLRSLADQKLIEQIERGRPGKSAAYAFTFDEWTFDAATERWGPPVQAGQPSDGSPVEHPSNDQETDGSPTGDASAGMGLPRDANGSPVGDPHQERPGSDTNQIRDDRNAGEDHKLDAAITGAIRERTGTTIPASWLPNAKRAIFETADGRPRPGIRDPIAYALAAIATEPDPRGRFLPSVHATPTAPAGRPDWCGEQACDPASRLRDDNPTGLPARCRCHPLHGQPLARAT